VLLNTVYHAAPGTAPPYVIRALSTPDMRSTFLDAVGDDDVMSRALFRAQVGSFFTDDAARAEHLPVLEARLVQSRPGLYGLTDGLGEVILARNANVPRMNAFRKPVVIAFGADDPFLNPMVAQAFADAFPTSKLTLVPSANHYVQLDAPNALVPLILGAATSE
jgi:pimeloyl-ACP methyl ester carboxylesterase